MSNWTATITPGFKPPAEPAATNTASMMAHQMGPPYPVNEAVVGGTPTVGVDDPISAVLLALFLATAAAHMTVFQINKRRGLKFIFSGMLFALGMLRSVALTMRIVWASNAHSIKVGIAAGILTQVGSVLILIINLILTQRIVRAYHPGFGWHKAPRFVLRFLVGSVVGCLVMLIVCTIQTFLTLDPTTRANDRKVQLFSATFLTTLAFLPVPIILLAAIAPRNNAIERFGAGSWRAKLWLILFTACLATLGAGFRAGTAFDARPHGASAWFLTRPCYYCFNYVTDLLCSVAYLFSRFDRRFIIPNGSCKPGDYSLGQFGSLSSPSWASGGSSPVREKTAPGGHGGLLQPNGFSTRSTVFNNSSTDAYRLDSSDLGAHVDSFDGRDGRDAWWYTSGGSATGSATDIDGAEVPGTLFGMIDNISNSSRDDVDLLPARPPPVVPNRIRVGRPDRVPPPPSTSLAGPAAHGSNSPYYSRRDVGGRGGGGGDGGGGTAGRSRYHDYRHNPVSPSSFETLFPAALLNEQRLDWPLGVHHGPTDRSHGADHDGFDGPRGGSDERRDVDGRSYGRTGGEKGERTKTV